MSSTFRKLASRWPSRLSERLRDITAEARYAARHCKRGYLAQLMDILDLRLSKGRLGLGDYYEYRLYDANACRFNDRRNFAGWRMVNALDKRLNQQSWLGMVNDKLTTYLILEALKLPYPPLLAVIGTARPYLPQTPTVGHIDQLHQLFSTSKLPIFAKPVQGSFGRGAMRIDGYDSDSGMLRLHDSTETPAHRLLDAALTGRGYLLQRVVEQAPELNQACGGRLGTIRASVLLQPNGPWLCHATWKITVGENLTDNIDYGKTGNLLGHVCVDSGRVLRVVGGLGRTLKFYESHPDTGERLQGLQLPHWTKLRALLERGTQAFPRLRFQHWDIALGVNGPEVLEINNNGDLYLAQQSERCGYLQPRFMDALKTG